MIERIVSSGSSGNVGVLAWQLTGLARVTPVRAYVLRRSVKLTNLRATAAEQAHFGPHPPAFWAAVIIAVELSGSALRFIDRWLWLSAGMLGVVTGLAVLTSDAVWIFERPARLAATNTSFEHLGLIGGFLLPHHSRQAGRR